MFNDKCSMISLPKLILASASPRRSEILTAVGWEFEKQTTDIDESILKGETAENYVQRLAAEKARFIAEKNADALVLGADTTVVIDEKIIGKPKDFEEAGEMIKMLSGNWHEVLTGVAVVRNSNALVNYERTSVKFAEMTEAEIEFLVRKGKPLDKAGAYAVQEQAALFIEKIEGDYWNVVGLPVNLVYSLVKAANKKG